MSHLEKLKRIKKIQSYLKQNRIPAYVIDTTVHLFYLTGLELSAGRVLITPKEATLIVDGRYFNQCKELSPIPVELLKDETLKELLKKGGKQLSFAQESTTYQSYLELKKVTDSLSIQLIPTQDIVQEVRIIKDEQEISCLRQAAKLGSKGMDFVLSILKVGISESQVARELEIFWLKEGSKKVSFEPIIAFGDHSAYPHYRPGNRRLKKGEIVLIDIGVYLNSYVSDMTRVHFFGNVNPKLKEIYKIVLEAQERALKKCKPGALIGDVDRAARDYIRKKGYEKEFSHGLGHGIGLDIHELPYLRNKAPMDKIPLVPGMAVTIEPGVYVPGLGGVRIEDSIVITKSGYENLTQYPK